jgi:ribosomal protein L21E
VVKVERRYTHPLLKKTVRRSKKYHAHDEAGSFKVGDSVWIEESKPISKLTKLGCARQRSQGVSRIIEARGRSTPVSRSPGAPLSGNRADME